MPVLREMDRSFSRMIEDKAKFETSAAFLERGRLLENVRHCRTQHLLMHELPMRPIGSPENLHGRRM